MTPEGRRVLQAVAQTERRSPGPVLPLKRIATATLGGNDELAARVLADLDDEGCLHTDTMGWQSGWLTPRGRTAASVEPS